MSITCPNCQKAISTPQRRSASQNSALHKYCANLAEALNDAGLDMRLVLEHHQELPWTPTSVKERLWRPVQQAMTGHESTTKPSTKDYPAIFETLSRHFASKHGVHVPWPSRESLEASHGN